MTVSEMAQKYYPRLWSKERLEALLAAGKLKQEDFDSIVKENYKISPLQTTSPLL